MSRTATLLCAILFGASLANGAAADSIESAGTGVAIALPVVAAGIAFYKKDWKGAVYLGLDTVATVGTAYALKQFVRERRPDGSDYKSFPSDTTALAASGSSFLWARYGWSYGIPALAATAFVGYSRVEADKHHWYDVAASEAIAIGYAALLTPRLKLRYNINSQLAPLPGGGAVRMTYNF